MWLRELNGLVISQKQYKNAVGNGAIGFMFLPIDIFIELTTKGIDRDVEAYFNRTTKELEEYNNFTIDGEILNMPFIKLESYRKNSFSHDEFKISSHEGRHRAWAMVQEGASLVPVVIYAREKSESWYGGGKKLSIKDFDTIFAIHGEYREETIHAFSTNSIFNIDDLQSY